MEKQLFFRQKENTTFLALLALIVLSFVLMHFQHNKNISSDKSTNPDSITTTSKLKVNSNSKNIKNNIPAFLPAL